MMDTVASFKAILTLFAGLALWSLIEALLPLRRREAWNRRHLLPNLMLSALTFTSGALLNGVALLALLWAQRTGVGLFNVVSVHPLVAVAGGILVLDLAWYATHVSMHKSPLLWRMHVIHHSDPAVDVTTTARQHPLESVYRYLFLIAFGVAIGASPVAFAIYRVWSAMHGQLEHANVRLPQWLDTAISYLFASPTMHKVHHSRHPKYTNTNYANIFSIWDRLFGSFTPARLGRDIDYGLEGYDTPDRQTLVGLLLEPFRRGVDSSGETRPTTREVRVAARTPAE